MKWLAKLNFASSDCCCKTGSVNNLRVGFCYAIYSLSMAGCSGCQPAPGQTHQAEQASTSTNDPNSVESGNQSATSSMAEATVQRFPSTKSETEDSAEPDAQAAAETNSSDTSIPLEPSAAGQRPRKKKPIPDAASTIKNVSSLRERVRQAKGRKDYGTAFHLATQAWEAARLHPKDNRLTQIADELGVELDTLGQQANSQFSGKAASSTTRLIDK